MAKEKGLHKDGCCGGNCGPNCVRMEDKASGLPSASTDSSSVTEPNTFVFAKCVTATVTFRGAESVTIAIAFPGAQPVTIVASNTKPISDAIAESYAFCNTRKVSKADQN